MINTRPYLVWILAALVVALVAFLGLSAYFFRAGMTEAAAELSAVQNATLNASRTLYGTVTAVDPGTRILSFRVLNPYVENGAPTVVSAEVPAAALISYEELTAGPDGTFNGDLTAIRNNLSDIKINDRVKVIAEPDPSRKVLIARIIFFGNPL